MSKPIIEFKDIPVEIKNVVEPMLIENLWICPLWMQKISVSWANWETEFALQWTLHKDYRFGHLTVAPSFLNYDNNDRREMVIHELVHSFTIPLKTAVDDAITDLEPDDKVAIILRRQINQVMEQVTQDFAFAIARK